MAVLGPSKNTRPERVVRMFLVRRGVRHGLHAALPGRPDIVIESIRLCVFVDGRFWHCPKRSKMRTMRAYWRRKLNANVRRDRRNRRRLRAIGFRTITLWDDGLPRGLKRLQKLIENLS